ncbi:MAG: hypothetical protein EOM52_12210, partial [Clostridia bacterium]|nr:hypothetical protein [Clostridia bacterium]
MHIWTGIWKAGLRHASGVAKPPETVYNKAQIQTRRCAEGGSAMETPKGIALTQLVEEMGMEIWHRSGDFDSIRITTEDVNRCGLQLTGFYGYFDPRRIQIMGLVETTYLAGLSAEDRRESFQALMSKRIPALVICRGIRPFPECVEMAERCDKPLLLTQDTTTVFMSRLI